MGLKRKKATEVAGREGIEWENLEAGEYEARLVYIADLGLQRNEYKGDFKGNFQQLSLGLEILDQGMENEETGEWMPRILWTKPFYIYEKMGEKSAEFAYYKIFDPSAKAETVPDWEAVLLEPCTVVIENVEGTGENKGKVYDNIQDLYAIPAKYRKDVEEATVEEPGVGDADDSNNPVNALLRGLCKHVFDKRVMDSDVSSKVEETDEVVEEKAAAKKAGKPAAKKATTKKTTSKGKTKAKAEEDVDESDPF